MSTYPSTNYRNRKKRQKVPLQTESELMDTALAIIARREYSEFELTKKLADKVENIDLIGPVILRLQALDYQNDQRYTECYIRYCAGQGKGEAWIKVKLRQKGIALNLIEACLEEADINWIEIAAAQLRKKFKEAAIDLREKARQYNYLAARGFSPNVVSVAVGCYVEDVTD